MFSQRDRLLGLRAGSEVSPVLHAAAQARGAHAAEQQHEHPERDDLARMAQDESGDGAHGRLNRGAVIDGRTPAAPVL